MTIMAEDTKISGKDLVLYPVPRNINFQDDWYQLDNGNINSDDYSLKAVNKIVDDAQQYLGVTLNKSDQSPVIVLEKDESLNEQGYSLTINQDGVQIKYKDEPGSYYAAVTLFQIMFQSGNNLPYLEIINDHPDFKYRGFMVDISRNRVCRVFRYCRL